MLRPNLNQSYDKMLNFSLDIVPLKAQFISKHSALNEIEMSEAMWGHRLTGGEKFYIQDKHKRDSFVFSSFYIYIYILYI